MLLTQSAAPVAALYAMVVKSGPKPSGLRAPSQCAAAPAG